MESSKNIARRIRRLCINRCAPETGNQISNADSNGAEPSKGERCLKPGPVVRNPYLNFLRDFRKKNCGLSAVETVKRGAQEWRKLSDDQKLRYIREAFYAPRLRRRRRRLLLTKSRSNSRKSSVTKSRRRANKSQGSPRRKC